MAGIVIAGPAAGMAISGDPARVTVHVRPDNRYSGDTSVESNRVFVTTEHVVVRYDVRVGSEARSVYVPDGMPLTDAFDELLRRAFGKVLL